MRMPWNNYFTAMKIFQETDDKRGLIDCYINLAAHYAVLGKLAEAQHDYLASLKIAEEIGDKRSIAWNYSSHRRYLFSTG